MKTRSADAVRAIIAEAYLRSADAHATIGSITLHPHQREAVARVETALATFGGALLADEVGLGKTYVALAVARSARSATRSLVVAPAALRGMWRAAMEATAVRAGIVSFEELSRSRTESAPLAPDFVIIDEAHHVRNPATRRYGVLARIARGAKVLLLSATPVHNHPRDLAALLALFLGERAGALAPSELAQCVIRRTQAASDVALGVPRIDPPRRIAISHDEEMLRLILALPPPLPPSDGADAWALLTVSLLRQWASSDGALRSALRRRLAATTGLLASLDAGRHPTRVELRAWSLADDAVQLAFPDLVAAPTDADCRALAERARAHERAVRLMLARLRVSGDRDIERAAKLRALRAQHPDECIVAFSHSADTVRSLYHHLCGDPGVAALTADGARTAGGELSRAEVVARLSPAAAASSPRVHARDRIALLLATDLLSEGVSLQGASVVVHLDLPWTPARLEQRVGRVVRIGSRHERVSVYVMAPPASAETLLRVERRLREKAALAGHTIGAMPLALPLTTGEGPGAVGVDRRAPPPARDGDASATELEEEIRAVLRRWHISSAARAAAGTGAWIEIPQARGSAPPRGARAARLVVGAACAEFDAFVALYRVGAVFELVAALGGAPTRDPRVVRDVVRAADGHTVRADCERVRPVLEALDRWRAESVGSNTIDGAGSRGGSAGARVLARLDALVRRAPPHRRAVLAGLVAAARGSVAASRGAGQELELERLAAPHGEVLALSDEEWIRAVIAAGAPHSNVAHPPTPELVALLVLISS